MKQTEMILVAGLAVLAYAVYKQKKRGDAKFNDIVASVEYNDIARIGFDSPPNTFTSMLSLSGNVAP